MMKVPNEPDLSPNNGLENMFLSDQSMASKMSTLGQLALTKIPDKSKLFETQAISPQYKGPPSGRVLRK